MAQFNVTDYGASSSATATQNRTAFQSAIDAAVAAGGGCIYVPSGTYKMDRATSLKSLDFGAATKILMYGDGESSILQMSGDGNFADWYLIYIYNSASRLVFRDLTFDGNHSVIIDADEQTHLVNIVGPVESIDFVNCRFASPYGDGIKARGETGSEVDRLRVTSCTFTDARRSGVTIQRAVTNAIVRDCYFSGGNDQAVDFEPTGSGAPSDILVAGCTMTTENPDSYVLTLGGIGNADQASRCIITNNNIRGSVLCLSALDHVISNNIIDAIGFSNLDAVLEFKKECNRVSVTGNLIKGGSIVGVRAVQQTSGNQTYFNIANNTVVVDGTAIYMESCDRVSVSNNLLSHSTAAADYGVDMRSTDAAIADVVVTGNIINTFANAMRFNASPNDISKLSISGNISTGDTTFLSLSETTGSFTTTPVVYGNQYDGTGVAGSVSVTGAASP